MNFTQIIQKKKDKIPLNAEEIQYMVTEFLNKKIPKYQMSAMLMAIYFNGMQEEEIYQLTKAMLHSGEMIHFEGREYIDKHSTGGVGDKTSFIVAPLAAACGIKVPMVAGRGLGHTGGTVDKIESITGMRTQLNLDEFKHLLDKNSIAIIGQTEKLAPADGVIYALRDVTATIDSFPLILSSILSKKLAEGAKGFVFDIKVGNGAFMKDMKSAENLAKGLVELAEKFGKKASALITEMSVPLGQCVGHSLELLECIDVLKGKGPKDLCDLSIELAAHMVLLGKKAPDLTSAKNMVTEVLHNGTAFEVFLNMVHAQGGDETQILKPETLPVSDHYFDLESRSGGWISAMDTFKIGLLCIQLGGGRMTQEDKIDHSVGFIVYKKTGMQVKKGEVLCRVYYNPQKEILLDQFKEELLSVFEINNKKVSSPKLIKKIITN